MALRWTIRALAIILLVVAPATALKAQTPQWPSLIELNKLLFSETGSESAAFAKISPSESSALLRITAASIDRKCGKVLDGKGPEATLRKLSVKRETLNADETRLMVVRGGDDWEDTADNCFSDGHMNFDIWVIEFSQGAPKVLLKSLAISYFLLPSQTNRYSDIVTAKGRDSHGMELVWWQFNGDRYIESRCASVRMSDGEPTTKLSSFSEHSCS